MTEFDVTLEAAERGPGCGIRLPFDPKAAFGRARAPVRVRVDSAGSFRTTVAVYGGAAWIGLRKDQQAAFGVRVGDRVHIRVERDDDAREIDLPPELSAALDAAPDAGERLAGLSYTHRREYARWVGEAKKAETRQTRAARAVSMLREGVRTPG